MTNTDEKSFEEQDQIQRRELALLELEKEIEAFRKTNPGSPTGRAAAKSLAEHIVLQTGSYRLTKEDWARYAPEVVNAFELAAEGYAAAMEAYDKKLGELIKAGKTNLEAVADLTADARGPKQYLELTREDCLYRLKLMIEQNLLDFTKTHYWTRRLLRDIARNEILDLMDKNSPASFNQTEALALLKRYEQMKILDQQEDSDIFKKLSSV